MCLKLYLPKDSLLSIDQGPDSHKLWGHVCDWEEDRECGSRTPGCSRTVQTYGRVACDRKDMSCRLLLEQHTCLFMKCCGSDSICLNSWQSLGILSSLASPATLKLMAGRSGISISGDGAAKMSMFSPRESDLNVGKSQTSHFQTFLHEQHYLFIVPTFPTEQLRRPLRLWVPHTELSLQHPAWETLFTHPFTPEKNYFLCAICSIPEGCLGLKEVTGGTMKLFTDAAVKI